MNWEPTADGLIRCTRHPDVAPWKPGRAHCPACVGDPGELEVDHQDLDAPTQAPVGCLTSTAHEAKLTETAKLIDDAARKLLDGKKGKGRINYATAFKGFEAALKFYNSALGLCTTRERREYVARLERLHRQRTRRRAGGSN